MNLDVYEQKEYLQSLADKNYKSTIDLSAIKYDIEVCKLPPALLKENIYNNNFIKFLTQFIHGTYYEKETKTLFYYPLRNATTFFLDTKNYTIGLTLVLDHYSWVNPASQNILTCNPHKSSFIEMSEHAIQLIINLYNKMPETSTTNDIFECKKIISSFDYSKKTLSTYLNNVQKACDLFGFSGLRPNQIEPVYTLLKGEDLLYVSATSSGKSFIYISTALATGYKTIIFSPLVSLIQDQANNLRKHGLRVGVLTSAVNSSEKKLALNLWENNELDFLFVAPERLQNKQFLEVMKKRPPEFVVVDEIHCAYEFAESFRASYKRIAPFVDEMSPKLFLGLTATMSKEVEESIRSTFNMYDTKKIVKTYDRPNLHYYSHYSVRSYNEELLALINQEPLVPTIVYFSTVKLVEETYKLLARSIKGGCMAYTGKMANSARAANQDNFLNGNVRVAFATNSFGMGVDKPNIGKVIFRTMPGSIEELVQGFGRGGRNGCNCDCILMYDAKSLDTQYWFKDMQYPEKYTIEKFYNALQTLKEDGDIVNQTLSSICNTAGVDPMFSNAIINILKGYNVVDREDRNNIAKIRFLDIPNEDDPKLNKKYKDYYDNIMLYGIEGDSYLSIDLELLSEELGVGIQTVKNNLKSFAEMELIDYKAPGSQPLKIKASIKNVDFNHIDYLRDLKESKIKEVLQYFKLDDTKKARYLEDYFKDKNGSN